MNTCYAPNCTRQHYAKGVCFMHYKRLRANGSIETRSTAKGAIPAFLRAAAVSESDECVPFPYNRDRNGYGHIRYQKRYFGAHVFVAELVHGPKPTSEHEACHSCGGGADGCVNGRHIYWGTRKQNVADAIDHGTALFWGVPAEEYSAYRAAGNHPR